MSGMLITEMNDRLAGTKNIVAFVYPDMHSTSEFYEQLHASEL